MQRPGSVTDAVRPSRARGGLAYGQLGRRSLLGDDFQKANLSARRQLAGYTAEAAELREEELALRRGREVGI
jgi:hypothetical protein